MFFSGTSSRVLFWYRLIRVVVDKGRWVAVVSTSEKYRTTLMPRLTCCAASGRSRVASAILDVGETTTFEVSYQSSLAKKSQGEVRLSVVDNQYEDCVIHLVAEAYQHDVSIDNVTSLAQLGEDADEVATVDDDVPGV